MSIVQFNLAEFNSDRDMKIIVENIERTIIELSSNTTEIPGRRGHVYEGNQIGAKVFSISAFLPSDTEEERVALGNELANFFAQLSDGNLYKFEPTDEPGRYYWVYPTNVSNMSRSGDGLTTGQLTFDLVAPEGLSYEELQSLPVGEPTVSITPNCNADTPPVLILNTQDFHKEITVSDGESYVSISKNVEQSSNLFYLNDELYQLPGGWTKLTKETVSFELNNGVVANDATLRTQGAHKIMVDSYGTNPDGLNPEINKWFGPAMRRNFGKQLEDWEIWMSVEFFNYYPRAMDTLELYLLDELGQRIGRLFIKDEGYAMTNFIGIEIYKDGNRKFIGTNETLGLNKKTEGSTKNKMITLNAALREVDVADGESVGEVKSKKYSVPNDTSTNSITNFVGVIGLRKVGNKYTAAIQYMDRDGKPYGKQYSQTFTDVDGLFGQKVAGMAYFFGKKNIDEDRNLPNPIWYAKNYVALRHIRVKELTSQGVSAEEFVAEPGDEIIFDMGNKKVYKNGILYMGDLNIGSKFFSLKPRQRNVIGFIPAPNTNNIWTVDYNARNN